MTEVKRKKPSPLLLFCLLFLCAVLIFVSVFGIAALVRQKNALYRYGQLTMDEGEYRVLASTFKHSYLVSLLRAGVEAYDAEAFWATPMVEGDAKTYGEDLEQRADAYIRGVLVGAALFDRYGSFTKEDRASVEQAVAQVLDYQAENDEALFNQLAAPMGFTYRDYADAAVLMYKSMYAATVIYGVEGENLQSDVDICNEYLQKTYTHVQLVFIRTDTTFLKDEDGNRIPNEFGSDSVRDLTPEEKEERALAILRMREAIEAKKNGTDGQVNPTMFQSYLTTYDEGDATHYEDGYYFAPEAAYTADLSEGLPEVVTTALSMTPGEYAEASYSAGVCFLYCTEPTENAFFDRNNLSFFSDFYEHAASWAHTEVLAAEVAHVTLSDSLSVPDLCTLPRNDCFTIRFS